MTDLPPLAVKVWGERACFTRPEMKVERVSYPVMTPSAARGVLEAIFWKPEFTWRVREIQVLKPIRHFSMVRNEVNSVASEKSAQSWATEGWPRSSAVRSPGRIGPDPNTATRRNCSASTWAIGSATVNP